MILFHPLSHLTFITEDSFLMIDLYIYIYIYHRRRYLTIVTDFCFSVTFITEDGFLMFDFVLYSFYPLKQMLTFKHRRQVCYRLIFYRSNIHHRMFRKN